MPEHVTTRDSGPCRGTSCDVTLSVSRKPSSHTVTAEGGSGDLLRPLAVRAPAQGRTCRAQTQRLRWSRRLQRRRPLGQQMAGA
jgi:hypothetical protein